MVEIFTGDVTGNNKSKDKTRQHKSHKSRQRKGKKGKKPHGKSPNLKQTEGDKVIRTKKHKDSKEEEPESEKDEDLGRKESYTILPRDTPRKTIKHRDMDELEMKKIVAKFKQKPAALPILDEKEKILMDRIIKKTYPMKYAKKEKWKTMLADEDNASFFAISKGQSVSAIIPEDTYDHVPKLAVVMAMKEEDVFGVGSRRPYWMEKVEPDDEDMKDTEPAISVGTEHIEQFQDKSFSLKAARDTELFLDEFAPLATLQANDDAFFHDHLVFSNTMRSLVNVQTDRLEYHHKRNKGVSGEEATQAGEGQVKARFSEEKPRCFKYSRIEPILSVRQILAEPPSPSKSRSSTTSSSGSGSGSEVLH